MLELITVMKIPPLIFHSPPPSCCNFLFVWAICPKLIKPGGMSNPLYSVAAWHSRIGLELALCVSLSLPVFARLSQLRNCLQPTQSGAGLKFPIGYVPICRRAHSDRCHQRTSIWITRQPAIFEFRRNGINTWLRFQTTQQHESRRNREQVKVSSFIY